MADADLTTTQPTTAADGRRRFHAIRVAEVVEETSDTRTFVMDVPPDLGSIFHYTPGQFCTVRATIDGREVSRCYSMSSAPATDERLAITVKRVPGGAMSNWLHDQIAEGDELEMMAPSGTFCERSGTAPILAFCGGSGVTPVFSILKQALATGQRRIRLLDANRDPGSIIFEQSLYQLAADHPERLEIQHHLDSESGLLGADDIRSFVGPDTDAEVFICGPTAFMDVVAAGVAAAGVPTGQVLIERFDTDGSATVAPATTSTATASTAAGDHQAGGGEVAGAADDGATELLTIRFKRKRHVVKHVAGDTVLEAARRAGLSPPFSCEQGNCATCMALVTAGSVEMRVNNALTDEEVAEGWVLTCQGLPITREVTVEYEDL